MSTSVEEIVFRYTGNDETTVFTFPTKFLANGDIDVYIDGVKQFSGFTVSGAGNPSGGYVTFSTAPATGESVVLVNEPPFTQLLDLTFNGKFPSTNMEESLDKKTMLSRILNARLDRAIRVPIYDEVIDPLSDAFKGKLIKISNDKKPEPLDITSAVIFAEGDAIFAENIAALKAIATAGLNNNDQASVLGYTSANDQGGGKFYWDSTSTDTADDGLIFEADDTATGRWKRIHDLTFYNVKWWGVKGDGVADETTLINGAITSIAALVDSTSILTAVELFFPKGIYQCAGVRVVNVPISLKGDGARLLLADEESYCLYYAPIPATGSRAGLSPDYYVDGFSFKSSWRTYYGVDVKTDAQMFQDKNWEILAISAGVVTAIKNVGIVMGNKKTNIKNCIFDIGCGILGYSSNQTQTGYLNNSQASAHALLDGSIDTCTFERCLYGIALLSDVNTASSFWYIGNINISNCYWRVINKAPILTYDSQNLSFNKCVSDSDGPFMLIRSTRVKFRASWLEGGIAAAPTHFNANEFEDVYAVAEDYSTITVDPGGGRDLSYNTRIISSEVYFSEDVKYDTFFATDGSDVVTEAKSRVAGRTNIDETSHAVIKAGEVATNLVQATIWDSTNTVKKTVPFIRPSLGSRINSASRNIALISEIKRYARRDKSNEYPQAFGDQMDTFFNSWPITCILDPSAPLYPKCFSADFSAATGSTPVLSNVNIPTTTEIGFVVHMLVNPSAYNVNGNFEISLNVGMHLELNEWQQVVAYLPAALLDAPPYVNPGYIGGQGAVFKLQNWIVTPVFSVQEAIEVMYSDKYPSGYALGDTVNGIIDPEWITGTHSFVGAVNGINVQMGRGNNHSENASFQKGQLLLVGEELDELWVKSTSAAWDFAIGDGTTYNRYAGQMAVAAPNVWEKVTLLNTTPVDASTDLVEFYIRTGPATMDVSWAYKVKRDVTIEPPAASYVD